MNNENINFIKAFLNEHDLFFDQMSEGNFKRDIFNKYTKSICELARDLEKGEITVIERYECAIIIWEISYKIQSLLTSHFDENDVYTIFNLGGNDLRQLSNILYYTSNWFSYGKKIDENLITLGAWD